MEEGEVKSLQVLPPSPTPCAFEWIYFARPDSVLDGTEAYEARVRMGVELFREAPAEADLVVPVPDSGIGAAVATPRPAGFPWSSASTRTPTPGAPSSSPPRSSAT